jgi:hypothetical protein
MEGLRYFATASNRLLGGWIKRDISLNLLVAGSNYTEINLRER